MVEILEHHTKSKTTKILNCNTFNVTKLYDYNWAVHTILCTNENYPLYKLHENDMVCNQNKCIGKSEINLRYTVETQESIQYSCCHWASLCILLVLARCIHSEWQIFLHHSDVTLLAPLLLVYADCMCILHTRYSITEKIVVTQLCTHRLCHILTPLTLWVIDQSPFSIVTILKEIGMKVTNLSIEALYSCTVNCLSTKITYEYTLLSSADSWNDRQQ